MLGDYYFDNENDKNLKFAISATMGGVYQNREDRFVDFVIDESIIRNMYIGNQQVLPLPSRYYQLSHNSRIIIPKGKLSGSVMVQLTEEFLNDPNAIGPTGTVYVIPLRITGSTTDSVLVGKAAVANPDYRISSDWDVAPKNYTLFGINYINEYHGNFLLRGRSVQLAREGVSVDTTIVYRTRDVETDREVVVRTASRNSVTFTKEIARLKESSPGNFTMRITIDANGNGNITTDPSSSFSVTGTAKFVKNSESWGGKPRHAFYLDYMVDDGTYKNMAKDTLVFRDKGVYFQEFSPVYKP
ncbi:MAG: hypothetical protein BWY67_02444 [Bacteroidetes bacterium ADurb.Bin397]|nr:MAG: hypothetical protein BWY67_02444 [Bacteroidetes bacterium ADurb.Bin397]